MDSKKIIIILGPTASGKTEWGIKIAKKFNGEVICADSRTIYKHLNIGTAKPRGRKCKGENLVKCSCMVVHGVKHYLLDFIDPRKVYTAATFQKDALFLIKMIHAKGKTPIIVGGTALYIYALTKGYQFSGKSDQDLRRELEKRSTKELQSIANKSGKINLNKSDFQNKRRLIRAIEVFRISDFAFRISQAQSPLPYSFLKIGIKRSRQELYKRIDQRTKTWFPSCHSGRTGRDPESRGIIDETKKLIKLGLGKDRINEIGLGYRESLKYLKGEIKSKKELEKKINFTQHAYLRRQMTWFKKDKNIYWHKNINDAEKLVDDFLNK